MSNDYHQRFLTILSDTTIDDFLKTTVGHYESIEGNNKVYEWVKQNIKPDADLKEFDEIFNSFLNANETLWFNFAWERGWYSGATRLLKLLEENDSTSTNGLSIIERNFLSFRDIKP